MSIEQVEVVVVGGGQAGIALSEHLSNAGVPHVIVLRTTPGKGIPTLERREKAHFVRIEPSDWDEFEKEFEALSAVTAGEGQP